MPALTSLRVFLIGCLVSCTQGEHIDCKYVLRTERVAAIGTCEVTGKVEWVGDISVYLISAGEKYGIDPLEMDEFKDGDIVSVRGVYRKSPKPFLYLSDLERATLHGSGEN